MRIKKTFQNILKHVLKVKGGENGKNTDEDTSGGNGRR